jgi:hypothetical protein
MYLAFGIPVRQDAAPVVLQYGAAVPSGEMTLADTRHHRDGRIGCRARGAVYLAPPDRYRGVEAATVSED